MYFSFVHSSYKIALGSLWSHPLHFLLLIACWDGVEAYSTIVLSLICSVEMYNKNVKGITSQASDGQPYAEDNHIQ